MKKIFSVIFLTLFCLPLIFASSSKTKTITGYIHMYSNAPFEFAGLVCDDGKSYAIKTEDDEELLQKILQCQGKKISLTGRLIKADKKNHFESLKDGIIVVSYFELALDSEGDKK
jgi:hypothetical protein